MTMAYSAYLFALANLIICSGIGFIAFCRLHLMNKSVLLRIRLEYALYIGGAVVAGLQPMWGEWPEWGSLAIGSAFFIGLLLGGIGWRDGPPESVTDNAPLSES